MKTCRFTLFIIAWITIGVVFPVFSYAADKDPNREELVNLLNELEKKVSDADKKMVAHPSFIKELQALVEKYRGKLRKVFLKEDFSDGDYTKDPKWEVLSGQFKITPSKRLQNTVLAERPVVKPAAKEKQDLFGVFLKEVLKPASEEEKEKATTAVIKEASIRTNVDIGPVFEVDFRIASESQWGSMEIVLLGGEKRIPFYRMVYNASPSSERPIQIFRERDSKSYLIDEATKYPSLDDGVLHRVQWIRDTQGKMKVLVDEKEILSTVEVFYNTNFSGLSIINRGGAYEWGPIDIFEAPKE